MLIFSKNSKNFISKLEIVLSQLCLFNVHLHGLSGMAIPIFDKFIEGCNVLLIPSYINLPPKIKKRLQLVEEVESKNRTEEKLKQDRIEDGTYCVVHSLS